MLFCIRDTRVEQRVHKIDNQIDDDEVHRDKERDALISA